MMADQPNPHIRAVPNPPDEKNETRELVKTVAITAAVSSLVGVFAVAGGQALFQTIRKGIKGRQAKAPAAPGIPAGVGTTSPMPPNFYGPPPGTRHYEEEMPEALRMEPRLRHTGPRRRKSGNDTDRIMQAFAAFEDRQDQRLRSIEQRLEDHYEEDDGTDGEAE